MARWGYWRQDWGVESITPAPISVFDDEELRRLDRQFHRALSGVNAGKTPPLNLLEYFTPPHRKNKGQALDFDKYRVVKDKKTGTYWLWKVSREQVGWEYLPPDVQGPRAPIYDLVLKKRLRKVASPPVRPPKGSKPDRWLQWYKNEALWRWRFDPERKNYWTVLRSSKDFIESYNEKEKDRFREDRAERRKAERIARAKVHEWYEAQRRRIQAFYRGANYDPNTGRRVRNPYGR